MYMCQIVCIVENILGQKQIRKGCFKYFFFYLKPQEEFEVLGNLLERDSKGGEGQEPERGNYIL